MTRSLEDERLRRLDIQGFDHVEEGRLAEVAPWLRLAFGLCALLAIVGTALASTPLLLLLAVIALVAAISPVHPFDLIYNFGIRHLRGTGPLPKRGPPSRFACGIGSVWLLATVWAFNSVDAVVGYVLGFSLGAVALLVSTTDICIPSMIFRVLFGPLQRRAPERGVDSAERGA